MVASEANEPGSESGKRGDAPQEGGASDHSAARLPRLSVMPVSAEHWAAIMEMARRP